MEADGSVTLVPRLPIAANQKEQQNEESDDEPSKTEQSDDEARKIEPSDDGGTLDPWAQAALKALGQRNAGKAAGKAAAAKAKKKQHKMQLKQRRQESHSSLLQRQSRK